MHHVSVRHELFHGGHSRSDLLGHVRGRLHDRSPLTVNGYAAGVQLFARRFEQTNREPFTPQAVTPTDVREYRQYLLTEKRRKANTTLAPTAWAQCGVNRKLAALTTFMAWVRRVLFQHAARLDLNCTPVFWHGGEKHA